MADKATIQGEAFYKSLAKLEALAGSGQQVAPTQGVDPNVAQAISEKISKGIALSNEEQEIVKSQICTGPNSERSSWPGGQSSDVPGNGPGADKIKEDGTDYNERGMRKSIQEKVAKGIPLSSDELALLKSDLEKGDMGQMPGMAKGDDKDEDDKEKFGRESMGKSFGSEAQENETLRKGIEISSFLSEMVKAFGAGLEGIEARVNARMDHVQEGISNMLGQFATEQGEFNKSLAEAVVNIGHGVGNNIAAVEQFAQAPAGPPKSQLQVINGGQQGFVQKSFGGPMGGEQINKSMVLNEMNEMLEKGQVSPLDIIKFDTTGEINPALQQQIFQKIQTGGR